MSAGEEILTWQGTVNDSKWLAKAESILTSAKESIIFRSSGVGNVGSIVISPVGSEISLTLKVNAMGKTQGVLRHMGDGTHLLAVCVFALSKALPFDMASPKGEVISKRVSASNPFMTSLGVPYEEVERISYELGLIPSPELKNMKGSAILF